MGLSEAFAKLGEAIGDLSSLDVQSFTGTLDATVQGEGGNIIDWKKLVAAAKAEGNISLVLASHFNFDGDATLFAASGEISADLQAAHDEAVMAGQQIRQDLFEFIADSGKNLLNL